MQGESSTRVVVRWELYTCRGKVAAVHLLGRIQLLTMLIKLPALTILSFWSFLWAVFISLLLFWVFFVLFIIYNFLFLLLFWVCVLGLFFGCSLLWWGQGFGGGIFVFNFF